MSEGRKTNVGKVPLIRGQARGFGCPDFLGVARFEQSAAHEDAGPNDSGLFRSNKAAKPCAPGPSDDCGWPGAVILKLGSQFFYLAVEGGTGLKRFQDAMAPAAKILGQRFDFSGATRPAIEHGQS